MAAASSESIARHQAIRRKHFSIALLTYLIWIGMGLCLWWLGLFALRLGEVVIPMWAIISGMLVTNGIFWALFRTGLNLHFREPSLSLPMMLVACCWAIVFAGGTPEVRGVTLINFMMVFLFGIFNLSAREYLVCLVFAVIGYALMVVATLPPDPSRALLALEVMYFLLLASALSWSVFFGHYVGRLREKLTERNHELKRTIGGLLRAVAQDDLTGARTRRYVMESLAQEHLRLERYGTPYSVLMLDLDHFKDINDTYGHAAGDAVLKELVLRVGAKLRGLDLVARGVDEGDGQEPEAVGRFGGDEFLLVLPDTRA